MKHIGIKIATILTCCIISIGIVGTAYMSEEERRSDYPIILNEIGRNFSLFTNEDAEYRDYVELYNAGETDLYLDGFYLSDTKAGINRFFLDGKSIGAKGYLTISLSKKSDQNTGDEYADFTIKDGGTVLYLYDDEEKLIDTVSIPKLKYDTSYARNEEAVWCQMSATPGAENAGATEMIPETLSMPEFSTESGFYSEGFLLEISAADDGKIYYTLDGSEPTSDSFLYEEPLLIEDVTGNENVYSARTDISAGFLATTDRYAVPDEPVDKAVIVRAAVFSKDGEQKSATATKTYFIGFEGRGYENYPVISLVTDPENLFDYQKGIYVLGERFDRFLASGEREKMSNPDNWQKWRANYRSKGRTKERPVHMDYFDAEHKLVLSEEGGMRIKGGATRSYPQKSLGLYAREIYSGKDEFSVPFFGEYARRDALLFSGANDYRIKMRDVLIHNVCKDLAFSTMESIPCYAFLDGEFWGIYHLMERYGGDYIEEHFDVPKEDVIMIKGGYLECGKEGDFKEWEHFKQLAEELDFSEQKDYLMIQEEMDLQSFLDYYGTQIYIARCEDWPDLNEATWKTKSKTDESYQDGKWRWMIYDLNWSSSCLSEFLADANTIAYVREESLLFENLMKNSEFRKEFVLNFCDLTNTCLSDEMLKTEFFRLYGLMREPMIRDLDRFYGDNRTVEDYEKESMDLHAFLERRYDSIMPYMKSEFGLQGTLEELNIEIEEKEGGTVVINHHVTPSFVGNVWSGRYFTDYPVTVTAIANQGYKFAGWSGDVRSTDTELSVMLQPGGTSVKATFVRK